MSKKSGGMSEKRGGMLKKSGGMSKKSGGCQKKAGGGQKKHPPFFYIRNILLHFPRSRCSRNIRLVCKGV